MTNWFENNQSKSVISYTIMIAGATWAISTFILQDNRLNLAKSELEAQKSLTEQYKSKVDLLQRDIDVLRSENSEYRSWLGQTKDAIPAILPRINELKKQIVTLQTRSNVSPTNRAIEGRSKTRDATAKLGTAYIDDITGLIFTVLSTSTERMARITVKFPEQASITEATISPGQQWHFKYQGNEFLLTVKTISFVGDYVDFQISSAP